MGKPRWCDRWFEREVKPRLRGRACLIRDADDFVMGFEQREDAERVREVLGKRLQRYGLTLHPGKTRLLPFLMDRDGLGLTVRTGTEPGQGPGLCHPGLPAGQR